jgi:translation initiation factor 2B subunit (eIF-2B alpha/beta/delta family)
MKEAEKKKKFQEISKGIKEIKIQGARNIAKKALYAYNLIPTKTSMKKLKSLRPTEPMLMNVLDKAEDGEKYETLLKHFDDAQDKINKIVYDLIEYDDVIYTHCHSTNVTKALIYAKNKGKNFEVYNTETRPLFQGRKTARELRKAGIKVTMFVDSAMDIALSRKQKSRTVSKIMVGADALLKEGVINKVGSGMLAKLAKINKVPLYVIADSWKYSSKHVKIEERDFHEVWKKIHKNSKIKIRNPAFELIPKKNIKGIVTELGLMTYKKFLKEVKKYR